tara:strand:- start:764 stop:1333 length:570 start_codon:yes stop_codon:yes gene_type:complete
MLELNVTDIKEYHVLKKAILSNTFPWYIEKYGDENILEKNNVNTFNFLCHIVVRRGEGKINSDIYEPTMDFLYACAKKHKFKIKKIYRMAYNLTYPCRLEKSGPHADLLTSHKNIIIYFKNDEYNLGTIVYEDKLKEDATSGYTNDSSHMKILKETKGHEGTGIMFDGENYHEAYFPKKGKRIALVVNI